jgi:hypothetical protein
MVTDKEIEEAFKESVDNGLETPDEVRFGELIPIFHAGAKWMQEKMKEELKNPKVLFDAVIDCNLLAGEIHWVKDGKILGKIANIENEEGKDEKRN